MHAIDLNCDLGEGAGNDVALMPLITSANIACGAHAGDAATMRETVRLALEHRVTIGAHPAFADRESFGRRELAVTPAEVRDLVLNQIHALQEIACELGAIVRHVKPHGALYNLAARDPHLANAITDAVHAVNSGMVLVGLAGSELVRAGRAHGLRVLSEVFADRTYQSDGCLTPRSQHGAIIEDDAIAVSQVLQMVRTGTVNAIDGGAVRVQADTVCLHGDGAQAVQFARRLRKALEKAGVRVQSYDDR